MPTRSALARTSGFGLSPRQRLLVVCAGLLLAQLAVIAAWLQAYGSDDRMHNRSSLRLLSQFLADTRPARLQATLTTLHQRWPQWQWRVWDDEHQLVAQAGEIPGELVHSDAQPLLWHGEYVGYLQWSTDQVNARPPTDHTGDHSLILLLFLLFAPLQYLALRPMLGPPPSKLSPGR